METVAVNGEVRRLEELRLGDFLQSFFFGAGFFETFLLTRGEPGFLARHLARLQASLHAHAARVRAPPVAVLTEAGVEPRVRERVRWLIRRHERPESDMALVLLNEADALSFFSLKASGFARLFTRAHTRREVAHTLARLRPTQRWRLARIRLAPHVRRLLEEAMGAPPLPAMPREEPGLKRGA
mgnify:CR=1 FL=1